MRYEPPFEEFRGGLSINNLKEEFRGISLKKFGCSAARNCKRNSDKNLEEKLDNIVLKIEEAFIMNFSF